ncbi:MAG TPA: nuclear transport factor 2 family protein [Pyrinomonadaceae bacterium]|jgi:ketosteroid isomerase-like protein
MSNLETIKEIYEAFGKGDVPTILSKLAEDVDWEKWSDNFSQKADVPYLRYKKGIPGVIEFFGEVANLGIKKFDVLALMEGAGRVAAEIEIEAEFFSDEEIHLWNFNDEGKVTRFRHYIDTAKHIAAAEEKTKSASS